MCALHTTSAHPLTYVLLQQPTAAILAALSYILCILKTEASSWLGVPVRLC